jgi:hypothetical protein
MSSLLTSNTFNAEAGLLHCVVQSSPPRRGWYPLSATARAAWLLTGAMAGGHCFE